jgi:hypothetical protein
MTRKKAGASSHSSVKLEATAAALFVLQEISPPSNKDEPDVSHGTALELEMIHCPQHLLICTH